MSLPVHEKRLAFVGWCVWMCRTWQDASGALQRHWYIWGGDGPDVFDCSGFPLHGVHLLGAPDLTESYWCDRMWNGTAEARGRDAWTRLRRHEVKPGDLCLYGRPEKATHVMVWMGDGSVVGPSGGTSETTSIEVARVRHHYVKRKPLVDYRNDFLGFVCFEPLEQLCT